MKKNIKVILLAAGVGRRFGNRTKKLPKCLVPLGPGEPNLLQRYLAIFRRLKLKNVLIVVGHQKDKIKRECARTGKGLDIQFVSNPQFKKGSIVSLYCALKKWAGDCLIMDADVYFQPTALMPLLKSPASSFLIDPRSKSGGEEMMLMSKGDRPIKISKKTDPSLKILGEATGILKLKAADTPLLASLIKKMLLEGKTGAEYEESYTELMKTRRIGFKKISGFWSEMDFEEDLSVIRKQLAV